MKIQHIIKLPLAAPFEGGSSKMYTILLLLIPLITTAQSDIDLLLKEYNTRRVPYISVGELAQNADDYIILDTRKKAEYEISHIPNAIWASEQVNDSTFVKAYPNKNQAIVVYCSVGIRSEDYGEQLQALGYTNVKNLYGSIFAWKDAGHDVFNTLEKPTDSVHVFSKVWGKYLKTGIKIYKDE